MTQTQDQARAVEAKSLGEKLCDAIRQRRETLKPRFWNHTSDVHKDDYEAVALAFAASLSHDETASAVIASQAETIAKQAEEIRRLTDELVLRPDADAVESEAINGSIWSDIADDLRVQVSALSAKLVESEAREAEAIAIMRELADENGNAIAGMARATLFLDALTLKGRSA